MAITTLQQVKDLMPGQWYGINKQPINASPGIMAAMWTVTGAPPAASAPSSGLSGDVPTKDTVGAIPFVNPASGSTYLAQFNMGTQSWGVLYLYDRLWQNSGINVTITTGQTINSAALTRPDANGVMAEAWWQTYATMGAGTPTVTLSYTNSAGTSGHSASSGVLTTTMGDRRTGQFQLAAGDTGVKSIQTWTANATFTSGTVGLVIRRKIAEVSVNPNEGFVTSDVFQTALANIPDNACLEVLYLPSTNSNAIMGDVSLVQG